MLTDRMPYRVAASIVEMMKSISITYLPGFPPDQIMICRNTYVTNLFAMMQMAKSVNIYQRVDEIVRQLNPTVCDDMNKYSVIFDSISAREINEEMQGEVTDFDKAVSAINKIQNIPR